MNKILNALPIAIIVYETYLHLSDEWKYIWKKPHRVGSILYLLSRYGTLVTIILVIFQFSLSPGLKVCFFSSS